jgi:4-amino-4-deoxy-L-arabinose transferase-like glycosyltransferase
VNQVQAGVSSRFDRKTPAALVVAFALAWAAASVLSTGVGAIHQDMVEAYVWGRQFELGYYKHPPLWAWITGAWLTVLPRAAWSMALLCAINVAAGLWGAWMLIGRFAEGERRLAALLLLMITPFYALTAYVFNANSIFLSLWPWTAYVFLLAMDRRRAVHAVLFGVLAAADMLSKYYALALLLTCLAAALAHPKARSYFTSLSPWISVVVGAVLVAPHVWWLTRTGFLPFSYFHGEAGLSLAYSAGTALKLLGGDLASLGLVIALVLGAARKKLGAIPARAAMLARDPALRVMTILATAPFVLTIVFGLVFRLKLSTNWTIAIFPLAPLLLIELADPPDPRRLARLAGVLAAIIAVLAMIVAAFSDRIGGQTARIIEPRREIAQVAAALWRARTTAPIAIVGGDDLYAEGVAFYGPDRPQMLVYFDPRLSPWIGAGDIARKGLLAVCPVADGACIAAEPRFSTPATTWSRLTLVHRFAGRAGPPTTFLVGVTPPAAR